MKLRTLLLLLVLGAIAVFAGLNWNTIITPNELSLGVTTVHVPLGLLMLGLLILLTVLFLLFVTYIQTSALLEARRHSKLLQVNRELADQAESSRFTELHHFLEAELTKQANLNAESQSAMLARVDRLENDLHAFIEQTGNTLAAYIGELEDRLDKTKKHG